MVGPVGIGNSSPQHALDVSGAIYSRLVTASGSNINWNAGNVQSLTLSSNPTLTFSNAQAGGEYKLIVKQDGTGNRTVTWPATVKWFGGGIAPTLTGAANSTDMMSFVYTGSEYLGSFNLNALGTPPPPPAIVRDNHAVFNSVTATSSYAVSFTINGTNDVILFVGYNGFVGGIGTDNIQSITWNGVNMQRDQYQFGGTDNVDAAIYHLAGASSGTHDIIVTLNTADNIQLYAASYTGAEQTAGALTNSAKAHNGASGGNSISVSLNPPNNSWAFATADFWNCDFVSTIGNHAVLDSPGSGCSRSFDSNGPLSPGSQLFGANYTGISGASLAAVIFGPAQ